MASLVKSRAKESEVMVVVYVDGVRRSSARNKIPARAVSHVTYAVLAQLEDPDLAGAEDERRSRKRRS